MFKALDLASLLFAVLGKAASLTDSLNPDWVPSVNFGYNKSLSAAEERMSRFKQLKTRVEVDINNVSKAFCYLLLPAVFGQFRY